jgi:hypothetical protein
VISIPPFPVIERSLPPEAGIEAARVEDALDTQVSRRSRASAGSLG